MVITVVVLAAMVFVLLLAWGDADSAPHWVKRINAGVTGWQENLLVRFGSWRHRRRHDQIPGTMVTRHYMSGAISATQQRGRGSIVRVLSPVTDPVEQRMFFLWEIGFHTELQLTVVDPNTVQVSKRDMKVLEEYCSLYATPTGKAAEVFRQHGLVLTNNR